MLFCGRKPDAIRKEAFSPLLLVQHLYCITFRTPCQQKSPIKKGFFYRNSQLALTSLSSMNSAFSVELLERTFFTVATILPPHGITGHTTTSGPIETLSGALCEILRARRRVIASV
jgi:hypothetical protein